MNNDLHVYGNVILIFYLEFTESVDVFLHDCIMVACSRFDTASNYILVISRRKLLSLSTKRTKATGCIILDEPRAIIRLLKHQLHDIKTSLADIMSLQLARNNNKIVDIIRRINQIRNLFVSFHLCRDGL
jgi:hypothetical protein